MKKNLFGMLTSCLTGLAILAICGAITTSCNKDDDNNTTPTPTPSPEPETPVSYYNVTLDMVIHKQALDMMTVDFFYTKADGKEDSMRIDKNTATNGQLTAFEKTFFDKDYALNMYKNEENHPGITEYLSSTNLNVYRVTLNNVASGTTLKTTAKSYILDSYQPAETNNYVLMPTVMPTREGNSNEFLSTIGFTMYFYRADNWARLKERLNGKEIPACMNTITLE